MPTLVPRMSFWADAFPQAWHLIVHRDPFLMHLVWVTLKVAGVSTAIATGGRAAARRWPWASAGSAAAGSGWRCANAGPRPATPVVVGLVLALLTLPATDRSGGTACCSRCTGVYVAQTVPRAAGHRRAHQRVHPGGVARAARPGARVRRQHRAPGRRRWRVREARVGILAADHRRGRLGAVRGRRGQCWPAATSWTYDQTLASAALEQVDAGHFVNGLAIGIVLLGLILIVTAALTVLQHRGGQPPGSATGMPVGMSQPDALLRGTTDVRVRRGRRGGPARRRPRRSRAGEVRRRPRAERCRARARCSNALGGRSEPPTRARSCRQRAGRHR